VGVLALLLCGAGCPDDVPKTAVNLILALCGSTLATYFASVRLRGKISAADIANATLAGGVALARPAT
jgi:ammonium transporter Rh